MDHTLCLARRHPLSLFQSPGIPSGIHHLHMAAKDKTYIILSGQEGEGERQREREGAWQNKRHCPLSWTTSLQREWECGLKPIQANRAYLNVNQKERVCETEKARVQETAATTHAHAQAHKTEMSRSNATSRHISTLLKLGCTRSHRVTPAWSWSQGNVERATSQELVVINEWWDVNIDGNTLCSPSTPSSINPGSEKWDGNQLRG